MLGDDFREIRESVEALCRRYPESYWRGLEECRRYPSEFIAEMTSAGFLACLIPERWGGSGLGLGEACAILEEVCRSGAHAGACHAQMYVMASILRHGSEEQKNAWLPEIAKGRIRFQSFAVTEPDTGSDTTRLKTAARKVNGTYLISGQKVWTSRVRHSDLMLLLARTSPIAEDADRTFGLSAFLVDLRDAESKGLAIRDIDAMINHHACELFLDEFPVPEENLVGEAGRGFRVVLDSMNAERILIAAECIGDARYFIEKASAYASERVVFGRPIGANQGIQFPIARSYAETSASSLMVRRAASLFDSGKRCGAEANMAKLLAADASWRAGDAAMQTFGGFAFSKEFNVERKFRETRLYQTAPVSTNLILSYLAERELNLPRSY
ncbi:MAG: acyl-CoA/acyl-ACP dehydrogenase [Albidovulum sp.]|nr:acyl-CoA/acyl-ACP dehydrogenase [Albidovulum sp.]MDE0533989.1 acyl-CoA/acyl-ACP dehydrogenase [Albidovulum sp.]